MHQRLLLASVVTFALGVAVAIGGSGLLPSLPLPPPAAVAPTPSAPPAPPVVEGASTRVLLAGMWSPAAARQHLGRLARCLEEETRHPTDVVLRERYAEGMRLLGARGAEIGLLCSGAAAASAVDGALREDYDVVYRLSRDGRSHYNAALIVRSADSAQGLDDLEGAEIAWTDPDSLTGYRALRAHLRGRGLDPDRYFLDSIFTNGHDRSIEAVRDGLVRAAAVDEMILASSAPTDLRVIWRSADFPSPPLVVSRRHPELAAALGRLATRPECLEVIGATELAPASWEDYAAIADIIEAGR